MTQEQKNKEFKAITDKMLDIYSSKNELYSDSFNQLIYEWGLVAGIIPIDNKLRRIKSIVRGTEVKYESLEDSLFDLANYSILMLIHLKEMRGDNDGNKDNNDDLDSFIKKHLTTNIDYPVLKTMSECKDCKDCFYYNQYLTIGDIPCNWCSNKGTWKLEF